jgi:beta-N-acetylhexosaminidase
VTRRLPTAATAAVAGLLALSSCGSDGPSGATAGAPARPTAEGAGTAGPTADRPDALPWGPTETEWERARGIVAALSPEQLAGQVIVASYPGPEPPVDLVRELHLGGVIVMGENVGSPEQLAGALRDLRDATADRSVPLVTAVDQEGGLVARVGEPATEFPSLMTLGAALDPALAADVAEASGRELRSLGIDMVFAPVADVTSGPDDPTIGSRSPSSDPKLVAEITRAGLEGYAAAGVVAVAKHFPGHGSVPADSHETLPVQEATVEELQRRDLVPFRAAAEAGAPAVMVAHVDVRAVDPGVPSSLSPAVIALLREDLGFEGLVVTDAQDMGAVTGAYGPGQAAVRAVAAGADVVLMPADVRAAHAALVSAVGSGDLPAQRLAEAASRVVALQLHQADSAPPPDPDALGSHADLSYAVSLAGLTVVAGPCEGRLVGDAVRVVGGSESDRSRFVDAARAAGLGVGSGDTVRLLGGAAPGAGDVVVALDTPYGLGGSTAGTAAIALYGRTPGAFRALVEVLTGTASGGGRLPVEVAGVERAGC